LIEIKSLPQHRRSQLDLPCPFQALCVGSPRRSDPFGLPRLPVAASRQHLASGFKGSWKIATLHASSEVAREMSVQGKHLNRTG
jgi:hypothetical protein